MNKSELVEAVAEQTGLSKSESEKALNAITGTITEQLSQGETVTLVGFGTFSVSKRAAREGRNPQTGATIQIGESIAPKFKAGKLLKDACNSLLEGVN